MADGMCATAVVCLGALGIMRPDRWDLASELERQMGYCARGHRESSKLRSTQWTTLEAAFDYFLKGVVPPVYEQHF